MYKMIIIFILSFMTLYSNSDLQTQSPLYIKEVDMDFQECIKRFNDQYNTNLSKKEIIEISREVFNSGFFSEEESTVGLYYALLMENATTIEKRHFISTIPSFISPLDTTSSIKRMLSHTEIPNSERDFYLGVSETLVGVVIIAISQGNPWTVAVGTALCADGIKKIADQDENINVDMRYPAEYTSFDDN